MIGGLVAGTVATAGASTLAQKPIDQAGLAASLTGDLSSAVRATTTVTPDAEQAPTTISLHSQSLDELRAQSAADRSEAREAPDAGSVDTLLAGSEFTAETVEVQVEAPAQEQATTQQTQTQTQSQGQTQQTQTQQTQSQPEAQSQPQPAAPAAPAPVGGSVLGVAASYVGYPYQLYGTPPNSFDCSGFTWWVFQQAGISIPRSVAGQRGAVTPVSNPQPGDLIFYNDWHHVGIYAGNGMTYEALNPSTGVRYGPLLSNNVWYGRVG